MLRFRALILNWVPPQFCHYNYICLYWIPHTNSNQKDLTQDLTSRPSLNMINQHSLVYLRFTNLAFLDPNSAPICTRRKRNCALFTAPCTWNERYSTVAANKLLSLLEEHGLIQHVNEPTRKQGSKQTWVNKETKRSRRHIRP